MYLSLLNQLVVMDMRERPSINGSCLVYSHLVVLTMHAELPSDLTLGTALTQGVTITLRDVVRHVTEEGGEVMVVTAGAPSHDTIEEYQNVPAHKGKVKVGLVGQIILCSAASTTTVCAAACLICVLSCANDKSIQHNS